MNTMGTAYMMHKVTWDEVKDKIGHANPYFPDVVSKLSLTESHSIYSAR